MKKSLIITIVCFVVGIVVLAGGFILLTDNEISRSIFTTTTTAAPKPEPKPEYKPMDFFKEDVSKYITLGQYKELKVGVDQIEVSDAEIDFEIHIMLCQKDRYSKEFKGKVAEKAVFSFDYTGYLLKDDGTRDKAFDGGAGKGQLAYIDGNNLVTLKVGSTQLGGFIDGFAQGMLGMSVDETKTLDITFPEDYHSADMAGKKVEFDVKIGYIAKTIFDNDAAKYISNDQYKTAKEYKDYLKNTGNTNLKSYNEQFIWSTIIDNSDFIEIPKQQYDYYYHSYADELQSYADQMGMSMDDFLKTYANYFGLGFSSLKELEELANNLVKQELVAFAIMKAENFQMTEDEYNAKLKELSDSMKKTPEELYKEYTEEFIRDFINEQVLMNKVTDFVTTQNECVKK